MDEVTKVLPSVFKRQMLRVDPPLVKVLTPLWSRVVGSAIAQQSRPEAFVAGTLTLVTADPTWAKALTSMREELRGKVNAYFGCPLVRAVHIRKVTKLTPPRPSTAKDSGQPEGIEPGPLGWPTAMEKLDPETARVARLSYAKYFARTRSGVA